MGGVDGGGCLCPTVNLWATSDELKVPTVCHTHLNSAVKEEKELETFIGSNVVDHTHKTTHKKSFNVASSIYEMTD